MATIIISYDLHKSGQNYDCISEKLKGYPTHWHMQQSVWLIKTDKSVTTVRDHLKTCLDSNDKLFVAKLTGAAAWHGLSDKGSKWLKSQLS